MLSRTVLTFSNSQWDPNTLFISKVDEVYIKIEAESPIKQELSDFFTFTVPNAKFTPAYKNRMWDGKIRLYNLNTRKIYSGLLPYIEGFCNEREYKIEYQNDVTSAHSFSKNEAMGFIKEINSKLKPREYQLKSFIHCVRNKRALIVSPTASGKSYIIYMLSKWYGPVEKKLIIVPTISLVNQMKSDFISYGYDKNRIHCITAGVEKQADEDVVISTWQSIYKLPKSYFEQYNVVIGDECHLYKAKSLTSIMTKLTNAPYRFGFTGTLDGMETNKLVVEGLFGKVKQYVTTKELIDKKTLANFRIKCLVLKHNEADSKLISSAKYKEEMDYLVSNQERNNFIKNLAVSLKGNSLLLFQYVEKHGKTLYEMCRKEADKNRKVFFVYGGVGADERESIRQITESETNAIIVASFGTFSTGINIKNLHNILFSSPTKSRIRNLQSIGRGLRVGDNKNKAVLYDIADDLRYKSKVNYTLEHFAERIKLYNEEQFEYKIYNINL